MLLKVLATLAREDVRARSLLAQVDTIESLSELVADQQHQGILLINTTEVKLIRVVMFR